MAVYVLGIDLGTQGARAIITDLAGRVNAEGACALPADAVTATGAAPGAGQDPRRWRVAVFGAIGQAVAAFTAAGRPPDNALAATGVGDAVPRRCDGQPVGAAMMYSDTRADAVAAGAGRWLRRPPPSASATTLHALQARLAGAARSASIRRAGSSAPRTSSAAGSPASEASPIGRTLKWATTSPLAWPAFIAATWGRWRQHAAGPGRPAA